MVTPHRRMRSLPCGGGFNNTPLSPEAVSVSCASVTSDDVMDTTLGNAALITTSAALPVVERSVTPSARTSSVLESTYVPGSSPMVVPGAASATTPARAATSAVVTTMSGGASSAQGGAGAHNPSAAPPPPWLPSPV